MENFGKGSMSHVHLFGNKLLTYFTRVLFRVSLKDPQSGTWGFSERKNFWTKLFCRRRACPSLKTSKLLL